MSLSPDSLYCSNGPRYSSLNTLGLIALPWCMPTFPPKSWVLPWGALIFAVVRSYVFCMMSTRCSDTPFFHRFQYTFSIRAHIPPTLDQRTIIYFPVVFQTVKIGWQLGKKGIRKRKGGEEQTLQNLLRRGLRSKVGVIPQSGRQSPSPNPRPPRQQEARDWWGLRLFFFFFFFLLHILSVI